MVLSYKKYEKKYLESCMELIRTTWLFEENFKHPRQPMYVYKYYVENCVNWSEHLELLVDEHDRVMGILFGSIEDNNYWKEFIFYLSQWKIDFLMRLHILIGDLGERRQAMATYKMMCQHDADGESVANDYDSEVNLFILDPSLRGQGYGRKLMDRYIKFCRKNDLDSVFLWTTTDCSFRFYEQYGFKERERFALGASSDGEASNEEGIVFYKKI